MPLTDKDRAKGRIRAIESLGPDGCSKRASIAARARWGHSAKPKKDRLLPALSLVSAWMAMHLEDHADAAGYCIAVGKLAEVLAWLKDARKE